MAPDSETSIVKESANKLVILGSGSAGFLSALTFLERMPDLDITVIHSSEIPIIGVGESTTASLPPFLHDRLKIDQSRFYQTVDPAAKLGIKLEWGTKQRPYYHFPFFPFGNDSDSPLPWRSKLAIAHAHPGFQDESQFSRRMDDDRSPILQSRDGTYHALPGFGYHLHNARFVSLLESLALERGVRLLDAEVQDVIKHESGRIDSLRLKDGRTIQGDLFLDCSGFRGFLIREAMQVPVKSYAQSLFCDRAVIGSWPRTDEPWHPYTTSSTMDHGWCWRIDFATQINCGYVYSSSFVSDDDAATELQAKYPRIGDSLRVIHFPSRRVERFWTHNVIAIGNASGFVEPLQATALQLIVEQARFAAEAVFDCGSPQNLHVPQSAIDTENRRFSRLWDDVRDFLSIHYRFNKLRDTNFWRHCREHTDLGTVADFVDFYQHVGPNDSARDLVYERGVFGLTNYALTLMGLSVPTHFQDTPTKDDLELWRSWTTHLDNFAAQAIPMQAARSLMARPDWQWPVLSAPNA